MKKNLISSILIVCFIIGCINARTITNKVKDFVNKNIIPTHKMTASYEFISGLDELVKSADTIVEAEGTNKYELIDYKGITMRKTTVKVLDVIKGDKQLKELKFLQTEGIKEEKPPVKGEKLLMFLRKGIDNPDSYVTFGGSQGIYNIVPSNSIKAGTDKNDNANKHIEPSLMVNKKILQDLSGSYDEIKKKLSK